MNVMGVPCGQNSSLNCEMGQLSVRSGSVCGALSVVHWPERVCGQ